MRSWGNPERFYDEAAAKRFAFMVAVLSVLKAKLEFTSQFNREWEQEFAAQ